MENQDNKPKTARRRGRIFFIALFIVILGLLGFQAARLAGKAGTAPGAPAEGEVEPAFAVNTTWARRGELIETLSINGDIIAYNSVDAYPETTGRITGLTVDLGDTVTKDQVIAWVDPSRPGMTFSQSPVKAPISGTGTAVVSKTGTMAAPQVPVVTIGDLAMLQARTYIPERYTSRISLYMPAVLRFETFPDETFQARVSEISPVVDPASRTMEIKMDITGQKKGIKPGMFAEIELVIDRKGEALRIPAAALVSRFGKEAVFVLNDDETVSLVPVKTGLQVDGIVEIVEGLDQDTEIVYQGTTQLEDQSRVRVITRLETLR